MLVTVLGVSVGLGVFAPRIAHAAAPEGHGWWNRLNDGATAATAVAPPDVPAGGLYVSGDVAGPKAVAAVSFSLSEGETPGELTLAIAGSGVRGAVSACAIPAGRVVPTQNGRWSDAPAYDAERCTEGVVDGDAVAFDVSTLAPGATGYVAFAVVPAGAASRAVFDAPVASSLSTTPATFSRPAAPAAGGQPAATTDSTGQPGTVEAPAAGVDPGPAPPPIAGAPGPAAGTSDDASGTPSGEGGGDQRALVRLTAPSGAGWYGTLGAAIGGMLLFGLLLFYSLGYGPLGARYDR